MKQRFAIAVMLVAALPLSSCFKGDPAAFPAKDIRDLEVFRYAPENVAVIMAIDFDLILRDPVFGPNILEMMREKPSPPTHLMTILPFYDRIDYIHGVTIYSRSAGDFGNIGQDLDKSVAFLSVEMDEASVRSAMQKDHPPLPYRGYQAFSLDDNAKILFLGNGKFLMGGDEEILKAIIDRAPEAPALNHHLFPDPGTLLYMYMRNDKKGGGIAKGTSVGEKVNFLELTVTITGEEILMAMTCDVDLPDEETAAALKNELQKSIPLAALFKDAAPEFRREPWGIIVTNRGVKSTVWGIIKEGF
jgi:hypothetical protein